MAVNVSKTKYIIFHTRGKNIDPNLKVYYNDNEPNENKPDLIYELERIYSNHITPELRSYKLLGIHLDEHLTFDCHQLPTDRRRVRTPPVVSICGVCTRIYICSV